MYVWKYCKHAKKKKKIHLWPSMIRYFIYIYIYLFRFHYFFLGVPEGILKALCVQRTFMTKLNKANLKNLA